ncbi:DUF6441 family protein [Salipiger sp. 1_MG-2023]|uniref:DUF6441 family protein n=1 Tax=Salipiger sp. 1_MG-2023 TaxID=3062665 RepID=UPI0026E3A920|nr:DUF6441 family protein [Salipiger sp. 1_MG-2023]MDO6587703.1 DUF6441 family protein [Salipiger sp. 1_MG-2023]
MNRLRIDAALDGDLQRFMQDELSTAEKAVTAGVRKTGARLKAALRQDVITGGLGPRLARSWQAQNYPRSGASLDAAAVVKTKAEKLISAFDEGSEIQSSEGFFLAIPTPSAPKTGAGRKRITPSNFPEHRYGPLRFVYVRGGTSLLVVDNQRAKKGGGYAPSRSKRALRTGYGLHTVPMFWLVPRARLRRRLNVRSVTAGAVAGLPRDIDKAFQLQPQRRGLR